MASCVLAGCLLLARGTAAQAPSTRLEAWAGVTFVSPAFDSAVTTSYTPLIQGYSAPLGGTTGGQTVRLEGGSPRGFGGGLTLFLSKHVGIQCLADTDRFDIYGTNADYAVLLNYTATQPPDYVPKPSSYSRTFTACGAGSDPGCVRPTTASVRQTSVGAGLAGRWRIGPALQFEASGGASYVEVRGDAEALRYTVFQMGGHGTLSSQEYQVAYAIGPARGIRVSLGASLDILLRRGLALVIDGRYLAGPDLSAPLRVTGVLNDDEVMSPQDPAVIQENLHPPSAAVSPSRARLLLGLKVLR